jgi:hypothetical protein
MALPNDQGWPKIESRGTMAIVTLSGLGKIFREDSSFGGLPSFLESVELVTIGSSNTDGSNQSAKIENFP